MGGRFRYFSGAVAFGFAAVWIMATLAAAVVCLLSAAAGYAAVVAAERVRARRAARGSGPSSRPPALEDFPLTPDVLNSDLGYVYEPSAAVSALTRAAEYGWALDDDAAASSETLH